MGEVEKVLAQDAAAHGDNLRSVALGVGGDSLADALLAALADGAGTDTDTDASTSASSSGDGDNLVSLDGEWDHVDFVEA